MNKTEDVDFGKYEDYLKNFYQSRNWAQHETLKHMPIIAAAQKLFLAIENMSQDQIDFMNWYTLERETNEPLSLREKLKLDFIMGEIHAKITHLLKQSCAGECNILFMYTALIELRCRRAGKPVLQ